MSTPPASASAGVTVGPRASVVLSATLTASEVKCQLSVNGREVEIIFGRHEIIVTEPDRAPGD